MQLPLNRALLLDLVYEVIQRRNSPPHLSAHSLRNLCVRRINKVRSSLRHEGVEQVLRSLRLAVVLAGSGCQGAR